MSFISLLSNSTKLVYLHCHCTLQNLRRKQFLIVDKDIIWGIFWLRAKHGKLEGRGKPDYCLSLCYCRQAPVCWSWCGGGGSVRDLQDQSHSMRHQGSPWGHKLPVGSEHECRAGGNIQTELQQSQCDEGPTELLSPQKTNRRGQVLGSQLGGRVSPPLCLSSCHCRSGSIIHLGWHWFGNLKY